MRVTTPVFECAGMSFDYRLGAVPFPALRDLSLQIPAGEMTCLAGPSGSGKSTLLKILGLIEPVQTGTVSFQGRQIQNLPEKEKNRIRRHELGFIFQNFVLFDSLSAVENVEYFLKNRGLSKSEKRGRAVAALEKVGLGSKLTQRPLEMSGGQRQRVAIARALAKQPKVIVADEPTASLDQSTGREVMKILSDLVEKEHLTVLLASHDSMAMSFAQNVVRLRDGRLEKIERQGGKSASPSMPQNRAEKPCEI